MLKLKKTSQENPPDRLLGKKNLIIQASTSKIIDTCFITASYTEKHDYIWIAYHRTNWAILIESDSSGIVSPSIALVFIESGGQLYPIRKEKFSFNLDIASIKLLRYHISMIAAHWITKEATHFSALTAHCLQFNDNSTLGAIADSEDIYIALLNGRIMPHEEKQDFALELDPQEN